MGGFYVIYCVSAKIERSAPPTNGSTVSNMPWMGNKEAINEWQTCLEQHTRVPTLNWRHNARNGVSNHQRLDCLLNCLFRRRHSVESPSMVDPQLDIWYWGSRWNLPTDCWSAVDCEWGTTSVYFGITYVCFIPSRLIVFAAEPQYLLQDFLFLS